MSTTRVASIVTVACALSSLSLFAAECTVEDLQGQAPRNTVIKAAKLVAAVGDIPAHCLVDASVTTPGNTVDFQLGLPANWNNKFYFQGVGGFAGSMGRLHTGLQRGYASATTDTGHQGAGTDGSWALNHRPKEIDYGHRGTHVTAVAAKLITQGYYGNAPRHAYFNGCSNGGRQALMEAQRYPDDFDGIIAGDPSFGALGYVRRAMTYQFMLASPDRILPMQKLDVLSKGVLAACDQRDGLADGLIGDPRDCAFDPATLICKNGDAADCLTDAQVDSIKAIYAEAKTRKGARIYGFPVGHEAGTTGWPLWMSGRTAPTQRADGKMTFDTDAPTGYRFVADFFRYMAFEKDDPNYDWRAFDVQRDLPKMATMTEILSPTDANLRKFNQHGGKLLLYHGWADPAISAYGTLDYYEQVVAKAGGKRQADDFVRLFLVPGMHHCAGGPGPNAFDSLTALEQWAENGIAPTRLIASQIVGDKVTRTRPLCPEPQVARYIGSGSIDDAQNFRCEQRK